MPQAILNRTVLREHEPILRRFEDVWRSGERPAIDEHLPEDGEERHALLVELVHLDVVYRHKAGDAARLEEYVARYPRLSSDRGALLGLIATEYEARRPKPVLSEYQERFPDLRDELPSLLAEPDTQTKAQSDTKPSRALSETPPESPLIAGYELQEELGRGGMGVVYRARQVCLDRIVALKLIRAGGHDAAELSRFRREAEAVGRLQHPNIVQVYEFGEHGGEPYLSQEYVDGGNLAQKLARLPQPPRDAASLAETLARAVHAVHQKGVIHRDLKPGNVLLTADGTPKITDFGLAKHLERADGQTKTGDVMGTPSYMSPEQAGGKTAEIGPATDVYALGAILYEMLTGRPPFQGATVMDVVLQAIHQEPVSPRRLQPSVPRDLETICLKCLAKEPQRRYASAEFLADDLRRFLGDKPIQARPTAVWERGLKWARRRPVLSLGVAGGVLLSVICACVALWYWDSQLRVKVEYYANVVRRRGVPEGIGRVTAQQARRRHETYRLSRRGGRVEKMEIVNGSDYLTPLHAQVAFLESQDFTGAYERRPECRYDYSRNEKGQMLEEVAHDRTGNIVWRLHYDTETTAHYTDQGGIPVSRANSGAAYVRITWSEAGFEEEVRYLDRNDKAQPGRDGTFGKRYERDGRGLVVEETFLGKDGRPGLHKEGFARRTLAYDGQGNLVEQAWFDKDGLPVLCAHGIARQQFAYDARGNCARWVYFGRNGQPTLCAHGVAAITITYDDRGNRVEEEDWGLDGELRNSPSTGVARMTWRFNERGDAIEQSYFAADGKPTLHKDGNAGWKARYDDRGNQIETAYFGLDGKPTLHKDGNAGWNARYDDRGNQIETSYFGLDGKPTLHKDGNAGWKARYDESGNQIETAYFGLDGKPTLHKDGNAGWNARYDAHGNLTEQSYFGVEGKPALLNDGYAKLTEVHDERGNMTEQNYFGVDGEPTLHKDGYARFTARYNESGNQIETAYFGLDGKSALHKDGNAGWRAQYDAGGNRIETAYFGLDGKLTLITEGYARFTARYDESGNRIETSYFGLDGKPALHKDGNAGWKARYDAHGNLTEQSYFGVDGKPILHKDGYAKITWRYDERNNPTAADYFGLDGQPILWTLNGAHRWTARYDNRNNQLIERTYYGLDGKTPARSGDGYEEEIAGLSVFVKSGYARTTRTFDPQGRLIDAAYFDDRDQPMSVEVVVRSVDAGSLAEKAGIKPGDVVETYAGEKVVNAFRLVERRRAEQAEMPPRELTFRRDDKAMKALVPSGALGAVLMDRIAPNR